MRILVVEDEEALRSFLVPRLEREGWQVDSAATGTAALAAVRSHRPDLVVLDVGLPDLSGLDVCRELRRLPGYLPVLMLTGLDSREDELRGFAADADDYVIKPVQPDTLVARIRALLRRSTAGRDLDRVWLGEVEVDLRTRTARRGGIDLGLGPREFDLLAFLLEHPGQVFGKTQLLTHVWGSDADVDTHAVTARISALRARVETNPNRPQYVLTRPGVGYYLQLPDPVSSESNESSAGNMAAPPRTDGQREQA